MADNNITNQSGDILSHLDGTASRDNAEQNRLLRSIDASLQQIIQEGRGMSSANAINAYGKSGGGYAYRDPRYSTAARTRDKSANNGSFDPDVIGQGIASEIAESIFKSRGGIDDIIKSISYNLTGPIKRGFETSVYDILDGIEHTIKVAVNSAESGGKWTENFSKRLSDSLSELADDLGVDVKDIRKGIGRQLGKKLLNNSDFKAIADFGRQFLQSQLDTIRDAYKTGKVASLQNISGTGHDQSKDLSEVVVPPTEPLVGEARRRLFENLVDESEANESAKQKSGKQDKSDKKSDESKAEKSVEEISIKAENCYVTAKDVDINIDGKDIQQYLNPQASATSAAQQAQQNQTQQNQTQGTELSDINEASASAANNKQLSMPEISAESVLSPNDTVNDYLNNRKKNDYISAQQVLDDQKKAIQQAVEEQTKAEQRYERPLPGQPRPQQAQDQGEPGYKKSEEMESIQSRTRTREYEREPAPTLEEIGKDESWKRKKTESKNDSSMPEITSEAVKAVTERGKTDGDPLAGLQNVFKVLRGESETLMKSNKRTNALLNVTKKGESLIGGNLSNFGQRVSGIFEQGKKQYLGEIAKGILPQEMSGLNGIISTLTGGATEAGAALSGVSGVLTALGPEVLLLVAGVSLAANALKKSFAPAIEGTKKLLKESEVVVGRFFTSQKNNLETAQKRLLEDVRTIVEEPFNILKKGAEEWYNAWDSNLRTINATQGYTKADLQNLMASFADRLRSENLTSVVSATDITNNLTKVLSSGLSGTIAEEFAYIATKLNAAIPTQDFFSYADTYASIAANAVRTGMSQTEAIEFANEQLTAFANNVLYASREVAGGFTTGLQNAEALFKQSVQIAQAGRSYNATEISGVLTAVSAITGAIAPDLASAMTDAIYKAAVGGNSTEIVALRSMAGINASNTEFLQELTSNPKRVFSELFKELALRQNMSEDAYMEVAEGLSGIFGLSADTFARVDFNYLAQAIDSMETASSALDKNMMLLASGETTTNAEQLKIQQINKMILDEGLSYVLDNEAARAIQQHMWDEQIARELQEAEYGVNLQGAALEFIRSIKETVYHILNMLNPLHLIQKIAELQMTYEEGDAIKDDVAKVLELGKVGNGNERSRYELVTRNQDLNVISDLVTLLGGESSFADAEAWRKGLQSLTSLDLAISNAKSAAASSKFVNSGFSELTKAESQYGWQSIGKSAAAMASSQQSSNDNVASVPDYQNQSEQSVDNADAMYRKNLQAMIDSMESFIKNNPEANYKDWVDTSRSYGISDFNAAIESAGLTNAEIEGHFDAIQTQLGAMQKKEREDREDTFWKDTGESLSTQNDLTRGLNELTSAISGSLDSAVTKLSEVTDALSDVAINMRSAADCLITMANDISAVKHDIDDSDGMRDKLSSAASNVASILSSIGSIPSAISTAGDAVKVEIVNQTTRVITTAFGEGSLTKNISDGVTTANQTLGAIYNVLSDGNWGLASTKQEIINFHSNFLNIFTGEGVRENLGGANNNSAANEQVIMYLEQIVAILQNGGTPVVTQLPNSLIGLSGALEGARGGYL